MGASVCIGCLRLRDALATAKSELEHLTAELAEAHERIRELVKLTALQGDDLKRLLALMERRGEPNQPERVSDDALQLAFKQILASRAHSEALEKALAEAKALEDAPTDDTSEAPEKKKKTKKRRTLSLEGLPIIEERIVPPEVEACGGEGWLLIDEEVSERLAYRRARFQCIRVVREKYVRVSPSGQWIPETITIPPLSDWLLPRMMADTSVIAEIVMGKYGFLTPLHRQERMNALRGFPLARSTQSDWIEAAHALAAPVVTAMQGESVNDSYCIATDATGAPVRIQGGRAHWHLFVFIADAEHIVFIPSRRHTGAAVRAMLVFGGGLSVIHFRRLKRSSREWIRCVPGGGIVIHRWPRSRLDRVVPWRVKPVRLDPSPSGPVWIFWRRWMSTV